MNDWQQDLAVETESFQRGVVVSDSFDCRASLEVGRRFQGSSLLTRRNPQGWLGMARQVNSFDANLHRSALERAEHVLTVIH